MALLSIAVLPTQTPTPVPTATPVPQNGHAEYIYDGDGNLVKSVINGVETYYPSPNYQLQITGSVQLETKYYFAGSSRIAFWVDGTITWLLTDHLGSTVGIVDEDGEFIGIVKYTAYGALRSGNSTTDYRYTGQREETEIGLYYYVARFYDTALGRFITPDTLIPNPGSSQGFDRFSYVSNNPINNNDPSGNIECEVDSEGNCVTLTIEQLMLTLEEKYAISITGNWTIEQLKNLRDALILYSNSLGSTEDFNAIINQIPQGNDELANQRIEINLEGDGKRSECDGYACWVAFSGTIYLSQNIFTNDYLRDFIGLKRRPKSLGLNNPNKSSQITVAHEITHAFADVFPDSQYIYALMVNNDFEFGGSFEESMASAIAIFAISNGRIYPGYQDQSIAASYILQSWGLQ